MTSISATAARNDLYNVIARVNLECKPITITNNKGKGAVLIGEDEWAAIQETLYLESIPGMVEKAREVMAEPVGNCIDTDELEW